MGSVPRFLNHKTFLITGATGFVAKGLVEKILRSAPEVRRIYLLVRPTRHSTVEERLEREVIASPAFDRLREIHGPRFTAMMREKLAVVAGDLTLDRLGLDTERYDELTREVDVVINSAATVVFDEQLDLALELNTFGPRRMLEFAKACRNAVFMHVSTAYVNGQRTGRVPEGPLPLDRSIADLIQGEANGGNGNGNGSGRYDVRQEIESCVAFCRKAEADSWLPAQQVEYRRAVDREHAGREMSDARLRHHLENQRLRWVKRRLVDEGIRRGRELGWHDCYTFTKAMGEQLIDLERGDLPVVFLRPSIIESSLAEPEAGFLDGLKVADPLILHYSKGRLPDFPADPRIVLDIIPVDLVTNAILAALPGARRGEIQVYHVATGTENPLKLGEMFDLIHDYFHRHPMQNRLGEAIRVRRWTFPSTERFRRLYQIKYLIPLNTILWLMEHCSALPWSPRLKQRVSVLEATLDRVLNLIQIYRPYMFLDCQFETKNTRRLFEELSPEDRKLFDFDVQRINWPAYIQGIHITALLRNATRELRGAHLSGRTVRRALPQDDSSRAGNVAVG
jgi:nucleoside-diphosphate-sugar epimerase